MDTLSNYFWNVIVAGASVITFLTGSATPSVQAPVIPAPQQNVGAAIPVVVARFETSLAAAVNSKTATSMTLVKGTDDAGNALSGYVGFVINEGATNEESVACTAAGTALTNCIRGISPTDGDLTVASLEQTHRRGESVKITDYPVIGVLARILNGQETVPNILTYDGTAATATIGSNLLNLASIGYVNGVASSGVADASTVTAGKVEQATKAEVASGTATGGTGAPLFIPAAYASTTGGNNTTTVVITNGSGTIAASFLPNTLTLKTTTSTATSTDTFNLLPAGVEMIYATSSAPAGWLLCDGTQYATSSYPRLFAVLGYVYGGSTSTFGVPDMRGRFVAGASTTLSTTIGATGGSTSTLITQNNLPAYTVTSSLSGYNYLGPGSGVNSFLGGSTAGGGTSFTWNSYGTANPANLSVTPPYIIQNYIIKY